MPQLNLILTAQDSARARAFYQSAFDATTRWAAPDGTWSVMEIGGREFCIEGNGPAGTLDTGFSLEVEDFERALTAVEHAGGQVYRPEGSALAVVTDTEGNRFTIIGAGGCSMHASKFPESTTPSAGT